MGLDSVGQRRSGNAPDEAIHADRPGLECQLEMFFLQKPDAFKHYGFHDQVRDLIAVPEGAHLAQAFDCGNRKLLELNLKIGPRPHTFTEILRFSDLRIRKGDKAIDLVVAQIEPARHGSEDRDRPCPAPLSGYA